MEFGCTVYNLHFVKTYNLLHLSEKKLKQLITVVLTTFTHLTLFNSSYKAIWQLWLIHLLFILPINKS